MKNRITFLIILVGLVGCNPDDEKVFGGGGNIESKPVASLLEGVDVSSNAVGLDAGNARPAARVVYALDIETKSGAKPCKGEVELELLTDFNMEFPTFEIKCLSMTIDLARVFGAQAGGGIGGSGGGDPANVEHDGKVLKLKKLAGATFEPARPMLIGPVIQNPKQYKGYRKTTKHSVQATDMKTGENKSGNGSLTVEVLDVSSKYENDLIDESFDDIIHWQITKKGFDGLNGSHGMLFDRLEFYWNMRPIMIPKIVIEGDMGAMIGGANGDSTSALLGILTITLEVKSYEILD